ncbi:hypothetical protein NOV72_04232 [Caballeronia novacaledonica]|uniref:Uncharacterized protein n=1 Tax=Caballeronia novacaledonica TaxID=1544861 RepID=A0A2U3IA43_9BURK|nr:hypothetical protein [Caballeronia novacaledonica]SPB17031.1 hypothetical protein NOV72_04232 [Caballeronia novacaledonica]
MFLTKCVYPVELKLNSLFREVAAIDQSFIYDNRLYVFSNDDGGYAYRSTSLDGAAVDKLHRDIRVVEVARSGRAGRKIDPKRKFQALALLQIGASVAAVSRGVNLSEATAYRYRKELQGVVVWPPRKTNALLRMLAFPASRGRGT